VPEVELPPDYDAPVFRALTDPVRFAGVHHETAVTMWGISVMLVFAGHKLSNWWVLLVAGGIHVLLALLTKRDPDFIPVLGHALFSPRKLEP
jgi:type IV secretory pathway VirB3-like protein